MLSEKGDCAGKSQPASGSHPANHTVQSMAMLRFMPTSDWVESHVLLRRKSTCAISIIIIIIIIIITTMPFVVLPQE